MLNVLVVGCGGIAPAHIEGYLAYPERCRIVALADPNEARARGLIEKYQIAGARAVADYRDALDEADLVSICTPPILHEDAAVAALNAGCHALVEKPMSPTLEACDRMIAAADANGRLLSVVGQSRFITGIRNAMDMIRGGDYGKIRYARIQSVWYRGQSYYDLAWRGRWTGEGGGCTQNHSIHHIDLLLWAKGMPKTVSAHLANLGHDNSEEEDFASAFLTYNDGTVAEITSALICHGEPQLLTFQMEKAGIAIPFTAYASKSRENGFPLPDEAMKAEVERDFAARPKLPQENHTGMIGNLLAAIAGEEPLMCTARNGRDCIELILAIYKSGVTGQTVTLPIAPDDPFYGDQWRKTAPHFHEKFRDIQAFADTTVTDFKGKF